MSGATKDPLHCAGCCILEAAILEIQGSLDSSKYHSLLRSARRHLSMATSTDNPHLFIATKTALEAAEAQDRGDDLLNGVFLFKNLVESINGGAREVEFGGRPRQGPKPSADQAFYRAAAVALWKQFPKNREKLVKEAQSIIEIDSLSKLRKLVDNFDQCHDADLSMSRSPLSVHMPLVNKLIANHNFTRLHDFRF
jgi:hypothetical protein